MKFLTPSSMILMVTMGCNCSCNHCCFACSPEKLSLRLSELEMMRYIRQAERYNISGIVFSGGEPMLLAKDLVKPMLLAKSIGMYIDIRSNAYWAKDYKIALKTVTHLKDMGLNRLGLSYDKYHAEKVAVQAIRNAVNVCDELDIVTFLDWIGDEPKSEVVKFLDIPEHVMRFVGSPMKAGRMSNNGYKQYGVEELCSRYNNYCSCVSWLMTVFPQGYASYHPCCWVNPDLIRKINKNDDNWIGDLFQAMQNSPMVNYLGDKGIKGLVRKAQSERPELLKEQYTHECEICYHLLGALFPKESSHLVDFLEDFKGVRDVLV